MNIYGDTTRIELMSLAHRAGAIPIHGPPFQLALMQNSSIERFADLVIAQEREACARIADRHHMPTIAAYIRARPIH